MLYEFVDRHIFQTVPEHVIRFTRSVKLAHAPFSCVDVALQPDLNKDFLSKESLTDWVRIDAMHDGDIDTSDIPPLTEDFFRRARIRMPKQEVTVHLERRPHPVVSVSG